MHGDLLGISRVFVLRNLPCVVGTGHVIHALPCVDRVFKARVLSSQRRIHKTALILDPDDFSSLFHQVLLQSAISLIDSGLLLMSGEQIRLQPLASIDEIRELLVDQNLYLIEDILLLIELGDQ